MQAPYTTFWGVFCVAPFALRIAMCAVVNSSFWETKLSPKEFFNFNPSAPPPPPHLGTAFFGGGVQGRGGIQNLVGLDGHEASIQIKVLEDPCLGWGSQFYLQVPNIGTPMGPHQ